MGQGDEGDEGDDTPRCEADRYHLSPISCIAAITFLWALRSSARKATSHAPASLLLSAHLTNAQCAHGANNGAGRHHWRDSDLGELSAGSVAEWFCRQPGG